ncbi:iron-containing redox enzyme family protein [Amycolatopsis sp. PS_44_ISF1]|uniref:iron-containing redox enzyme family protein n=1 Tax=Amycolatopsis sp. PS_44_ISF1 TaxID=2974917 RepID=UPI0028E02A65|nr:iron-containing redox enzyme family protein [Amycolatopsis sp. PS_44_ISF1]MDT8915995.1 iron-containing redox enzyme family protein [Amycolatopsis sp. PS_44_ISF1]
MLLPTPRGPVSEILVSVFRTSPGADAEALLKTVSAADVEKISEEDLQLSLFLCYGPQYCLFGESVQSWEWESSLIELRKRLEVRFDRELREAVSELPDVGVAKLPDFLMELGRPRGGRSLSRYLKQDATMEQFREFLMHRSVYSLMEADHHSLVIPRVRGGGKPALVEIQSDEYGGGVPGRLHSQLFELTLSELGMHTRFGAYFEKVPACALATVNVISYFGTYGRHRGAVLGNLAVTEIGSHHVNQNFRNGLRRLDGPDESWLFFQEHIVADAVHEQLAAYDMCGEFVRENPGELAEVVFGAMVTAELGARANEYLLSCWERGESALRGAMPAVAGR